MSKETKSFNSFMKLADRYDVEKILSLIILTERQRKIFDMRYINGYDINFIADTIGCCSRVVQKELRTVRTKFAKFIGI